MEQQLEKINNKLSKKRIDYIEVSGICSDEGRIKQEFT